ncbi:MAG: hypothetical protein ACREF3_07215 [Acetobacteraceae bacterium]
MRKMTFINAVGAIALAIASMLPTVASATRVSISGTWSRSQIKKDCDAAGGVCGNCQGKSGRYECELSPGGGSVYCTARGKCTGYVPRQRNPPHTLGGILHPPSGIKTTGGGAAPQQGKGRPVNVGGVTPAHGGVKTTGGNTPITIMRHEEHHSGGAHK